MPSAKPAISFPDFAACRGSRDREHWLHELPQIVAEVEQAWSLRLSPANPSPDATCSWVVPAQCRDGSHAILKVGLPHFEARDEARGLRFWDSDPTVRLLDYSEAHNAMLLERCEPGTPLRQQPESRQDTVIASLLKRLWRMPAERDGFRHLAEMIAFWSQETRSQSAQWHDSGLVRDGLCLFEELPQPTGDDALLATDLHSGNVLSARRKPWLVIDPKPFVGDRAYDATQHLLNGEPRLFAKPQETIRRFADLLEVDRERVYLWLFARLAAEPGRCLQSNSRELALLLSRKAVSA
jgi:streptomycin 6-kinase